MSRRRWHARSALAPAALALLLAACRDAAPTAPQSRLAPHAANATAGATSTRPSPVRIVGLSLASTTLAIGGPSTTYHVVLQNNGNAPQLGLLLQGEIVQSAVHAAAGGTLVNCLAGVPGVVPSGSCAMASATSASNTSVTGGVLVPGPATFVLHLMQASPGQSTELDTRSVAVTLISDQPYISSVTLNPATLRIGVPRSYSITIENPTGAAISGVIVQTYVDQGKIQAGGNGGLVQCAEGGQFDRLPPGTCTLTLSTVAPLGNGLTVGAATWDVYLYQGTVDPSTVYDHKSLAVTLTDFVPYIANVAFNTTQQNGLFQLAIGRPTDITITFANPTGAAWTGLAFETLVTQGSTIWAPAGGSYLFCAPDDTQGLLPAGTCTMSFTITPSGDASYGLTVAPGTLTIKLYQGDDTNVVDSWSAPVYLNPFER